MSAILDKLFGLKQSLPAQKAEAEAEAQRKAEAISKEFTILESYDTLLQSVEYLKKQVSACADRFETDITSCPKRAQSTWRLAAGSTMEEVILPHLIFEYAARNRVEMLKELEEFVLVPAQRAAEDYAKKHAAVLKKHGIL